MAWMMLIFAGLLEIGWAFTMKLSNGFTHPVYSIITIAGVIASLYCFHSQ